MVEKPCIFDHSIECPPRKASKKPWDLAYLVDKACPICPIHERIMIEARKEKKTTSELLREAMTEESS